MEETQESGTIRQGAQYRYKFLRSSEIIPTTVQIGLLLDTF